MRLLINSDEYSNHKEYLIKCFSKYKEAYIAVAFLKLSGLIEIEEYICKFLNKGGKIVIIAGLNFALTEPKALKKLRKIIDNSSRSNIFLSKAESSKDIFHPKLYLFKGAGKYCIITGSANLTRGGLIDNKEVSTVLKFSEEKQLWKNAKEYFDMLTNKENADEATLLVIKQYEAFYEQQKQHNKRSKAIPHRKKSQIDFNYENLLKHYRKFDNKERKREYKNKLNSYKKAKNILDLIADSPGLTQKKFEVYLDELVGSKGKGRLWYSGSLFRQRRKVYPYFKEFRDLVKYIRANKKENANIIFQEGKKIVCNIPGAAANYLAEIMMTYNNDDYANINRNPITVLRDEAGVSLKSHSSSFSGDDYMEYCELIKEICIKLRLKNMLEADSFFNDIYWELVDKKAPELLRVP